ncbi:MAG TPA: hypothetical protein VG500_02000 [Gemmatimonadales bacterium]|jgi:hypothetical protein|nr:hypothetical protein [Gemmatimonadales bacterium]
MTAAGPSTTLTEAELQAATGRGADGEFTRMARQIPGFGGMHYDKAGRLTVYLKPPAAGAALRSSDVMTSLRAVGNAAVQQRLSRSASVVTKVAKYDYVELQAYRARLSKIFGVKGVVFVDTDEEQNRLRIGIQPSASEASVQQALARAGVPRDVVLLSRIPEVKQVKNLQDRQRPLPGGFQIVFAAPSIDPNLLFVCTIGFNARLASHPDRQFFVTASHCSDIQGGNQQTDYYNPFPQAGRPNADRIAREFKDPRYGRAGDNCVFYPGFRCRFSDALLARYTNGNFSDFGTIARTTFARQRIGSLKIKNNNPRWTVVGEFGFPFLNEIAHKVGRTSGHTFGPVIFTCVDTGVSGTDIVQICQDFVLAGVFGGDSGSPVFEQVGPDEIVLVGVLWGGGTVDGAPVFIFSSMENIELELGPLATSQFDLLASQ